jgi:hypothetical protein
MATLIEFVLIGLLEPVRLLGRLMLEVTGMGWCNEDVDDILSTTSTIAALLSYRGLRSGFLKEDPQYGLIPVGDEMYSILDKCEKEYSIFRRAWWLVGQETINACMVEAWHNECARHVKA